MPDRSNRTKSGLHTPLVRGATTTHIVICVPDVPLEKVAELMTGHRRKGSSPESTSVGMGARAMRRTRFVNEVPCRSLVRTVPAQHVVSRRAGMPCQKGTT